MSDGSIVAEKVTWLLGGMSSLTKVLGHQSGEWQLRVTWFVARASSSGLVPGGRADGGWEEEWDMNTFLFPESLSLNKSEGLLGFFVLFFFSFPKWYLSDCLKRPRVWESGSKDWVEPLHTG